MTDSGQIANGSDVYRSRIQTWLDYVPMRAQAVAWLAQQSMQAYLVGGSVRDALLARPAKDMDLVVAQGAVPLARALADHLSAAFVLLDLERDVARVVSHTPDDEQHIDLSGFRAPTLEGDLLARDYTANAIAVELTPQIGRLFDPSGGQADIAAGILRAAYPQAFIDDPLRILRGLRQAGALGFILDRDTLDMMRRDRPGLAEVSPERIRDELFQIADLPDAQTMLAQGAELGLWPVLFGPEGIADEAHAGWRALEMLEEAYSDGGPLVRAGLGDYANALAQHTFQELSAGRRRGSLLKLTLWLASWLGDQPALAALAGLHLSRRELGVARHALAAQADEGYWSNAKPAEPLDLYRFFRAYGDGGVDGGLIRWCRDREAGRCLGWLLDAWFHQYQRIVDPPALVTGHELIQQVGLTPGPELGRALEAVREAQVAGIVSSRQSAFRYLRRSGAPQKR